MAKGINSYIKKADKEKVWQIKECMYCGATADLCIDHILPPSIGGDSKLSNLTRACIGCNSMKNSDGVDRFEERVAWKVSQLEKSLAKYQNILSKLQSKSYKIFTDAETVHCD